MATATTKPTKAIVGTIIAGVSAFITPVLATIIAGNEVSAAIWATGALAALGFAALAFPSIYNTTNKLK
jgi:hypothetical protein